MSDAADAGIPWAVLLTTLALGGEAARDADLRLVHEDALMPDIRVKVSAQQVPPRPDERFWYSSPDEWAFGWGVADDGLGEAVKDAGPCLTFKSSGAYRPRVRSPRSIALLREHDMGGGDFAFEVEAMQTGIETPHRDLVLVFGFESPERYFYAHLGMVPDATSSNVFEVNGAPRTRLGEIGERRISWGRGIWRRLRLECTDRTARVFLDGSSEPHFEVPLGREPTGLIGFGSFDDAGAFRNLRVYRGAGSADGDGAQKSTRDPWRTSPFGTPTVACRRISEAQGAVKQKVLDRGGKAVATEVLRVDAGKGAFQVTVADADRDGRVGSAGDSWSLQAPQPENEERAEALRVGDMAALDEGILIRDDLCVEPRLEGDGCWVAPFTVSVLVPSDD
ncbi:MAG: hypothetical protein AAGG01_05940 [Planctomycetota bacterium]